MSPDHVKPGKANRCHDVHGGVTEETESEECRKEVGDQRMHEVVDNADAGASPSRAKAPNTGQVPQCSANLAGDGLVVDQSDLDVSFSLRRHQRLFLGWCIWLVGVGGRLALDDGSGGAGLDHGQSGHDLSNGVLDLRLVSVCASPQDIVAAALRRSVSLCITYRCHQEKRQEGGNDDGQHLPWLHLHLWRRVLVQVRVLLQLRHHLWTGSAQVLLRGLIAALGQVAEDLSVDAGHGDCDGGGDGVMEEEECQMGEVGSKEKEK